MFTLERSYGVEPFESKHFDLELQSILVVLKPHQIVTIVTKHTKHEQ